MRNKVVAITCLLLVFLNSTMSVYAATDIVVSTGQPIEVSSNYLSDLPDKFVADTVVNWLLKGWSLTFNDSDITIDDLKTQVRNFSDVQYDAWATAYKWHMPAGHSDVTPDIMYWWYTNDIPSAYKDDSNSNSPSPTPEPEPTYPVSDQERTLASMILNRPLYVNTYGEYLSQTPASPFFWSISGSWFYYIHSDYPLRLFYNTSERNVYLYRYYNNTWERYDNVYVPSGTTYYGNFWLGSNIYGSLPHSAEKDIVSMSSNGFSMSNQFNNTSSGYNTKNVSLLTALISCVGNFSGVPFYVGNSFATALPIIPEIPAPTPPSIVLNQDSFEVSQTPVQYTIPSGTMFDYKELLRIIINKINSLGTLSIDDIMNLFVDVDGNKVLPTISVVRTDYDVLFNEQYQPLLLNYGDAPKFDQPDVSTALEYVTKNNIVVESAKILPTELLEVLSGCGIILLFVLMYKKFLQ